MDKPFVVCHMLSSLDGKINGDFLFASQCTSALEEYHRLRSFYNCQATLYGTVTMEESYAEGLVENLPHSMDVYAIEDYVAPSRMRNYIVAIDPNGTLAWKSNEMMRKNRPGSHIIEVLTKKVPNDYIAYLRRLDISYLFAGEETLDCALVLHKLKHLFGIERLMIAGGGLTNWSFLQEDLIDEFSLVMAPLTNGCRSTATVFERADFLPRRTPVVFNLKEVKQLSGDSLWLRYLPKR